MQSAPCRSATSARRTSRMAVVVVWSLVVAVASMVFGAAPASAHTGFESSTPADQSTVEEAVELVTISFTGEATPVGDGFVALNARGELQAPVSVSTLDDQMFTMRFDPPLAGGQVGIRWNVKAADAHPIEGAFSFTVTAPLPTTAPPSTVPAATTPATTEGSELPASSEIPASSAAPVPSEVAAEETETTDVAVAVGGDVTASGDGSAASAPSLDEFLAVDDSGPGETLSLIGRILGLVGVALALGAVAFGFTALRGPRFELRTFLAATAGVSGVLVVGALVEYVGVVRLGDESIGSAWSSSPGFATVLRVAGGIALIIGLVVTMRRDEFSMVRAPRGLSAAAAVEDLTTLDAPARADERVRWVPTRYAWPIGVGVVLVLVSFWFDGHTVSKGVRPLHAMVNTVHVAAGSIWVGGVVSLCAVAWARHRRGAEAGVAESVVRFSRVATVALVAVVLAGAAMAFIVLDSFGDVTGTEWGQTLLLKSAAVAVAAAIGAYNHFRLVPVLDAEPESAALASRVRSTVTAEAIVLVFVVIVTAFLVAAATA